MEPREAVLLVADALLREYMTRKDLKKTLAAFDEESPRTDKTIGSRTKLARILGIDSIVLKNRSSDLPFSAMLETIVFHLLTTRDSRQHENEVAVKEEASAKEQGSHRGASAQAAPHSSSSSVLGAKRSTEEETLRSTEGGTFRRAEEGAPRSTEVRAPQGTDGWTLPSSLSMSPVASSTMAPDKVVAVTEPRGRLASTRSGASAVLSGRSEGSEWIVADSEGVNFSSTPERPSSAGRGTEPLTPLPSLAGAASQPSRRGSSEPFLKDVHLDDFEVEEVPLMASRPASTVRPATQGDPLAAQSWSSPSAPFIHSSTSLTSSPAAPSSATQLDPRLHSPPRGGGRPGSGGSTTTGTSTSGIGSSTSNSASSSGGGGAASAWRALSMSDAASLHNLVFGVDSKRVWTPEWKQGFVFTDNSPDLYYGLEQVKGGPCGVIAAVQGWLLYFLLHSAHDDGTELTPDEALVEALATILETAAHGMTVKAALAGPPRGGKTLDGVCELILVRDVERGQPLRDLIIENSDVFFARSGLGLILFVVSVALTRGLVEARGDMDDPSGSLITSFNYCSQELVALLLCGVARSNVFDGVRELGGADGVLRGMTGEPRVVGYLSMAEHEGHLEVGASLKVPTHSIWVVSAQSHYSILFAKDERVGVDDSSFDVFFYDPLGGQDEEIRITVDPLKMVKENDGLLRSPLTSFVDKVIRTRWPRATIKWNDYEPLL